MLNRLSYPGFPGVIILEVKPLVLFIVFCRMKP